MRRVYHSLPVFEGRESRRHMDFPLWKLKATAAAWRLRQPMRARRARTLVQFLGFPRSGHSLIGALLDAHPDSVVAHELDVMGLLHHGMSGPSILSLIAWNAHGFARSGHYWNNFCYRVPGRTQRSRRPLVFGDKKGDWAVRWLQREPELLETLGGAFPDMSLRWIVVLRNPWDNISTMALRTGSKYDQLRIETGSESEFRRRLRDGSPPGIPDTVPDEVLTDYLDLCETIGRLKESIPSEDWHELVYDDFLREPGAALRDLCVFLGMEPDPSYIEAATSIVHQKPHRSRDHIHWGKEQLERVDRAVRESTILAPFRSETPPRMLPDD